MPRVQTIYLPQFETAITTDLRAGHPALAIIKPDDSAELRRIVGNYAEGQIFLVDPLGNLMMQYAPGTEMADIRKDLGHLLKLSGIG
jgi:hypothetical protein